MRIVRAAAAAGIIATVGLAPPAGAAESVHIEASTPFDGSTATFVSNLEGCATGTVEDGRASFSGSNNFGIFNGFKHFTCADGSTFTIRLQAKFDDTGSIGSWAFVGGGLHGSGRLDGVPFADGGGITDIYDGTLRP